jgi:nicotinamidase-related amidase
MPERYVESQPYPWPFNGDLRPQNTALLVIDMQGDFLCPGGFIDQLGADHRAARACIGPLQQALAAARDAGYHVIFTREGHRPDLYDVPANQRWRLRKVGAPVGECGKCGAKSLTRGEPLWDIIPELRPRPGEPIVDKPGKGAFYATDLEALLRNRGIVNLALTGVTTDCCVHSTLREASDRGFECVLLEDCCGAIDTEMHALLMKRGRQRAIFGTVATSKEWMAAITAGGEA